MALDDLIRYESAAVAAMNVQNEKSLAVLAMKSQYQTILGKDFDSDPVIGHALEEALKGGEKYGITNLGIANAIETYSQKYQNSLISTKFSDLMEYLGNGFNIPVEAKEALSAYGEMTLVDLGGKLKDKDLSKEDKEKIQKAVQAIEVLKERRLRTKTMEIYNSLTRQTLESLYPKEEKKEE